jgi:ribonuclease R
MVAANVAVARRFSEEGPVDLQVHPPPGVADLEKLRDLLLNFGLTLPEPSKVRSRDLQRVLEKAKGLPGEKFIGIQVLRAMKLAVYSSKNVSHYGLAKVDYTHQFRPSAAIPTCRPPPSQAPPRPRGAGRFPQAIAAGSSDRERNAAEAEQALVEWRIFRFLKDRLGEEFGGIVVDVVKAGLVVEIDEYFVAGLLPFASLSGDFEPKPAARRLRPKRRRKTFDLGDAVRVILVSCDPALRRMSFVPAADPEERRR